MWQCVALVDCTCRCDFVSTVKHEPSGPTSCEEWKDGSLHHAKLLEPDFTHDPWSDPAPGLRVNIKIIYNEQALATGIYLVVIIDEVLYHVYDFCDVVISFAV